MGVHPIALIFVIAGLDPMLGSTPGFLNSGVKSGYATSERCSLK